MKKRRILQPIAHKGQSLVEVIIVIAIVALLVTGLVVATTSSLKASQFARNKAIAVKYAQEGIELARSDRDISWTEFSTRSGMYCLDDVTREFVPAASCSPNVANNTLTRSVDFSWNGTRMQVAVTVNWIDGDGPHTSQLVTNFYKWR